MISLRGYISKQLFENHCLLEDHQSFVVWGIMIHSEYILMWVSVCVGVCVNQQTSVKLVIYHSFVQEE